LDRRRNFLAGRAELAQLVLGLAVARLAGAFPELGRLVPQIFGLVHDIPPFEGTPAGRQAACEMRSASCRARRLVLTRSIVAITSSAAMPSRRITRCAIGSASSSSMLGS